ncbi:MAG TPA: hypothetical protein VH855_16620 [Acetobacteraceae bacterium]|jgi:hypothetical protein
MPVRRLQPEDRRAGAYLAGLVTTQAKQIDPRRRTVTTAVAALP